MKLTKLFEQLGAITRDFVTSRTAALEKRIAELEERKYVGVWQRGLEYRPGNLTTHAGCLWLCSKVTQACPDESDDDWKLTSKMQ